MKILYISTWFPYPPDNGSKLRAHYLIQALSQKHQVSVVAFQPENVEQLSTTRTNDSLAVWGVSEDPFRYVNLPQLAKYLSPIPLAAWSSGEMSQTVTSVASQERWDAVVAFQLPAARYASIPLCKARIFDIDNSLSYLTSERAAHASTVLARLKARISLYKSARYESRLASQFDTCTVVSPLEVDFIENLVKDSSCRVEVSANGVDCDHNRPRPAVSRSNTLVYNGSLTYSANYDAMRWFLAKIFPEIRRKVPDTTLSITGSTRDVNLAGLALDEAIALTGYVEDVRLPVSEAAVCVVPIRQGSGTRLKILEAMALGTPVVTTTKGAEGLEVVAGEHLLIADNAQDFARSVNNLLGDSLLRDRLSANARRLVEEKYDWRLIGGQFVTLVEDTVQEAQNRER